MRDAPPRRRSGLVAASSSRPGSAWFADAQRARILRAACEIAAERGHARTSVAQITARAGVSRRTFYDCFASSEACYLAALEEAFSEIAHVVVPAYEGSGSWTACIRASLGALLVFLDGHPAIASLAFLDRPGVVAPSVLELRLRMLDRLIPVLEQGRSKAGSRRAPPSLTAEGIVGAATAVIHARLRRQGPGGLRHLTSPLMAMIVLPYLGPAAAASEELRPPPDLPPAPAAAKRRKSPPLDSLNMRVTYRTLRVLEAVAARPGACNRDVADGAGISDQGQISKLLARLQGLGLLRNTGAGAAVGSRNAWRLTTLGGELARAMGPAANGRVRER